MPNKTTDTEVDDMMLSAMLDGELPAAEVDQVCIRWRGDAVARRKWHDYQLIGDVLRSDDLARSSAHDRALFARIRTELANQPVVLAPEVGGQRHAPPDRGSKDVLGSRASHPGWAWAAVAAGVLAVSGTWVLTQEPTERLVNTLADRGSQVPAAVPASAAKGLGVEPVMPVAVNTTLVPDSKLDPYLAAHKQFSSVTFTGTPSGSLRQVAAEVSGR